MVGPRVFTVEEANELVPKFEQAFELIDDLRGQLRATKIKLTALEMIWGGELQKKSCPDRGEVASLVDQLKELEERFQAVLAGLAQESVTVKDVEMGLVDVYHVREGRLVNLCWKRGEEQFATWHHVDEGFAGRAPI
ncbi:MAG: DUF2203 family protein [Planctomycetota bacterium]|jgi:hypothetical protein